MKLSNDKVLRRERGVEKFGRDRLRRGGNFFVKGSFTPQNLKKMAFFGYPHAPRATAQGIHFRSTAIVQSVSGDARDVLLLLSFWPTVRSRPMP